jgi:hypothetical protein
MTQKATSASNSPDEPATSKIVQPDTSEIGTAPEVPHEVAKQYNLHKEPLHRSLKGSPAAASAEDTELPEDASDSRLEDSETEAAVDDILSKESDELLGIEDGKTAARAPTGQGFGTKLKNFFKAWWRNQVARYVTIGVVVATLLALSIIPTTRYGVLNFVGVRSSASVVVLDAATQLPLKNVTVSLNSKTAQTNREGIATMQGLKLGEYRLQVKRIAFAPYKQQLTIGWGSNPLGKIKLQAVGTQYQLEVKDYLSGKPITGAEVESDAVNALSDAAGRIVLTVEDTSITKLAVRLNAPGYRPETMELDASTAAITPITLVPAQKTVYVSKASGKYDVYSSYLDGKDKKILLAGSGLETNNVSLAVSPDGQQAVLVSTRDNLRDEDGYLLYSLTFINIDEGTSVTVDHAQQLQLVDWINDRLVYRSTIAGSSGSSPQRNRLIAYNFTANSRVQLAAANQFNTILSADGYIYYAVSGTDPAATLGLFRVKPDSSSRERLSEHEIWTGLRTNLTNLSLQTADGWLSYELSSKKLQKASAPSSFVSIIFTTKGKKTAWTETRDGKGVLLVKEDSADKITTLTSQPGLAYPVRWLGDKVLTYRVATSGESADYAISTDGGAPRKISDVTATNSYIQAY